MYLVPPSTDNSNGNLDRIHPYVHVFDFADIVHSKGVVQFYQKEAKRAHTEFHRAYTVRRKIYDEDSCHPRIVVSLLHLGHSCTAEKNYDSAIEYYSKCLDKSELLYGVTSMHLTIVLVSLGHALRLKGLVEKAKQNYKRAIKLEKSHRVSQIADRRTALAGMKYV